MKNQIAKCDYFLNASIKKFKEAQKDLLIHTEQFARSIVEMDEKLHFNSPLSGEQVCEFIEVISHYLEKTKTDDGFSFRGEFFPAKVIYYLAIRIMENVSLIEGGTKVLNSIESEESKDLFHSEYFYKLYDNIESSLQDLLIVLHEYID